ncbi:MAG: hypothetical protein HY842_19140 [Bacteroidetes bacterium]|nr:hypothetical protein [Bacteroidota bacterium]
MRNPECSNKNTLALNIKEATHTLVQPLPNKPDKLTSRKLLWQLTLAGSRTEKPGKKAFFPNFAGIFIASQEFAHLKFFQLI